MEYLDTLNLNLEKNGWELLINKNTSLTVKVGDLVKIIAAIVSPLDYEINEVIRSVSHVALWVKIEKQEDGRFIGALKTAAGYDTQIKDGTKFVIGNKILFQQQNIFSVR